MTVADELRKYADRALKEDGMYFSGIYLDGLAKRAESEQAMNYKLRELLLDAWRCIHTGVNCFDCRLIVGGCTLQTAMHELGIEVEK